MPKVNSFQKGDEKRRNRKSQLERIQEMKEMIEQENSQNQISEQNDGNNIINPINQNNSLEFISEANNDANYINAVVEDKENNMTNTVINNQINASVQQLNNNANEDFFNPDNVDLDAFFDKKQNMYQEIVTRTYSIDATLLTTLNAIAKSKKIKKSVFYRTLLGTAIKEELSNLNNNIPTGYGLGRKKKMPLTIKIPVEYDNMIIKAKDLLQIQNPDIIYSKSEIVEYLFVAMSKRFI